MDTPMYDDMATAKRPGPSMAMTKNGAPIAVALDQQSTEVQNLIDEVHMLLDKIRPVCGPEYPMPADTDSGMASPETSEVADNINSNSRNLANLRRTVKSVRERVEL